MVVFANVVNNASRPFPHQFFLDVNQGKKKGKFINFLSIDFHKVSVVAPCAFIAAHQKIVDGMRNCMI